MVKMRLDSGISAQKKPVEYDKRSEENLKIVHLKNGCWHDKMFNDFRANYIYR